MKLFRASVLLLMILACPLVAGGGLDLKIGGDTVVVVKTLPCTITATPGADFYVWSLPSGVKATDKDNVLTVTVAPSGDSTIKVLAVTIDFEVGKDGKVVKKNKKENASLVLTNGYTPPKPPAPPTPADPLMTAFQAAYDLDADADREKSLAFLAAAYKGMATQAATRTDLKTNADFVAWVKTVLTAPGVGLTATQLVSLRKAVGAEVSKAWGATKAPLSPTDAAAELTKVANALSGVR